MLTSRAEPEPLSLALEVEGREVALKLRRRPGARGLKLTVDPATGTASLTLPPRASLARALRFVDGQHGWIARQLARLPERRPFAPGSELPFLGESLLLLHRPERRGVAWREGAALVVTGDAAFFERRVADWLKRQARREVTECAAAKAARVERRIAGITLRDPTTRWGSCSARGRLNFSWRLVMAPDWVLDYVVAHEVAHLVHMNHGPAFWALTRRLAPRTEEARGWMRQNGPALWSYGPPPGS